LQGDDFVKRLLSPVSLDQLILLANSGWSISRILRVCVQQMNGVANAPRASGPTPVTPPVYADFVRLTNLLRDLQLANALEVGYTTEDGQSPPVLHLTPGGQDLPALAEVRSLLGLEPDRDDFILSQDAISDQRNYIRISTRSLLGMLFYLSQSVAVPAADEQAGKVTVTRNADGSPFDWSEVTRDLFQVKSSATKPQAAAVVARYRGHWFYIDDTDLDSKSTFAFLSQLFALQAGSAEAIRPVLTLPVGP
jgi:hypothetical protein